MYKREKEAIQWGRQHGVLASGHKSGCLWGIFLELNDAYGLFFGPFFFHALRSFQERLYKFLTLSRHILWAANWCGGADVVGNVFFLFFLFSIREVLNGIKMGPSKPHSCTPKSHTLGWCTVVFENLVQLSVLLFHHGIFEALISDQNILLQIRQQKLKHTLKQNCIILE